MNEDDVRTVGTLLDRHPLVATVIDCLFKLEDAIAAERRRFDPSADVIEALEGAKDSYVLVLRALYARLDVMPQAEFEREMSDLRLMASGKEAPASPEEGGSALLGLLRTRETGLRGDDLDAALALHIEELMANQNVRKLVEAAMARFVKGHDAVHSAADSEPRP